ncbi:hypothetical protein EDD11_003229 [Mortierella claussenii]|nr:hypothetical protein EDD11_003229 [Mortierella claussenii]
MPLSEANLCKHTMQMSPVSRQAKLVHILGYVDRQRELVSSADEEIHHATVDKASRMTMTKNGRLIAAIRAGADATALPATTSIPSTPATPTAASPFAHLPIAMRMSTQQLKPSIPQQLPKSTKEKQLSEPIVSPTLESFAQQQYHKVPKPLPALPTSQRLKHYRDVSGAVLDPSLALPRALPPQLVAPRYDLGMYLDSAYPSPAEAVDAVFQQAASSDKNDDREDDEDSDDGYSPNDSVPAHKFLPSHQDEYRQYYSPLRGSDVAAHPIMYKRHHTVKEFDVKRRPLIRQVSSGSMGRTYKKLGRLGTGFAFLSKGRRPNQRYNGSLNGCEEEERSDFMDQGRFRFLTQRSAQAMKATLAATAGDSSETMSDEVEMRPRGTVKQLFLDVFKKSSNKTAPVPVPVPVPAAALVSFPMEAAAAASRSSREELLCPELRYLSPEKREKLLSIWPVHIHQIQRRAIEVEEDFQDSCSSDNSPRTAVQTPESAPSSTTLRPSGSYDRLYTYGGFGKDDETEEEQQEQNEEEGEEDDFLKMRMQKQGLDDKNLVPIASLIRELAAFGLDYVSHQPYSSQAKMMMADQQSIDLECAGLRYGHNHVVAAM